MKGPYSSKELFLAAGGVASMRTSIGYRFLMMGLRLGLGIVMATGLVQAQQFGRVPSESDLYCSGLPTNQPVPADTYLISGENSRYKNAFQQGDYVYINRGAEQGVKVGDEFEVIRPERDPLENKWFKWQEQLTRATGATYSDIGQVRLIPVHAKTSIPDLKFTC